MHGNRLENQGNAIGHYSGVVSNFEGAGKMHGKRLENQVIAIGHYTSGPPINSYILFISGKSNPTQDQSNISKKITMAIKIVLVNNVLCDKNLFNNKADIIKTVDAIIIGEAAIANRNDRGNITPSFGSENFNASMYV